MTPEEQQLLAVARAITEQSPVDWAEAERSAADGSLRETLRELKVIAEIAALHGSDRQTDTAERWGPLMLLEHVGHGSFGDVYRALDTRLDREVALKLMRRADTPRDRLGTTVIDEARLLARVRHPNVVTIYGADRIEGRVGLWMEFVRGRTLEDLLQTRGPLPSDEVTTIGRDICHALAAVHEAGLLHRDIKAQNVVQEPGGRLVLMDFGAGGEAGDEDAALAGTPLYLAPEVLEGRAASVQSDIYSVGVLLYHLLTGGYPVAGRTVQEIRDGHRHTTRAALGPGVSPGLAAVVRRALEPDPANRYRLAADMAAVLETDEAAVPRQGYRWRPPALAAALVATVLTAGAAWLLGTRNFSSSSERVRADAPGTFVPATSFSGQDGRAISPRLIGYGDEGGSIDSSGRWMALTDRSGFDPYHLVVRDIGENTRQDTRLATGARGTTFFSALSSDARKVAYAGRTPDGRAVLLVSANAADSSPTTVVDDTRYIDITPAAWSSDDRRILATIERPDHSAELVWITEADGHLEVLKPLGWRLRGVSGRPALSPDGQYVAYAALATQPTSATSDLSSTAQHIYIVAADFSGRESEVVQENTINESPIWSRDGANVLFMSSNLSGTWDLHMVSVRNGEAGRVATQVWRGLGCCHVLHGISPQGLLRYSKRRPVEERSEIVEMESAGAKVKGSPPVVRKSLEGTLPQWSWDGQSIATKVKAPGEGRVRQVDSSDYTTKVYSVDSWESKPKLYSLRARRTQVVWQRDDTGFLETISATGGVKPPQFLYRVDAQTGEPRVMFEFPRSVLTKTMASFFQVSDDSRTLYAFASDRDGRPRQLVAIDVGSRRVKKVIHEFTEDGAALELSPADRNTLAVVTGGVSRTSLSRVDVSGENYVELYRATNHQAVQISPPALAWTNDGLGILFVLEEPFSPSHALPPWGLRDVNVITTQRIMHVDAHGATPPPTPTPTGVDIKSARLQQISLSPDGSWLAYGVATGARELWELDLSWVLEERK